MSAIFHGGAPPEERVLWEGRPTWQSILRHVFHVRALVLYFIAIVIWLFFKMSSSGQFDDLEAPGRRILMDDDGGVPPEAAKTTHRRSAPAQSDQQN